jgi:transcriptional regulator with XRE-family HTH domain
VADNSASPLGEFIRRQREMSEVSMRQFADLVGISNPYLSQIERGLRAPSEQVVQSIADALQVSADTLYEQAGLKSEEDGASEVIEVIRRDPKLTGRQRQALIEIYESFTGVRPRPRRRRAAANAGEAGAPEAGSRTGAAGSPDSDTGSGASPLDAAADAP